MSSRGRRRFAAPIVAALLTAMAPAAAPAAWPEGSRQTVERSVVAVAPLDPASGPDLRVLQGPAGRVTRELLPGQRRPDAKRGADRSRTSRS